MAKLTEKQKNLIEVLCIYEIQAEKERQANGVTDEYDSLQWMVVRKRKELGLDILAHQQRAADRDDAKTGAA